MVMPSQAEQIVFCEPKQLPTSRAVPGPHTWQLAHTVWLVGVASADAYRSASQPTMSVHTTSEVEEHGADWYVFDWHSEQGTHVLAFCQ